MDNKTLVSQIHDVIDNYSTVYEQGSGWGAWNGWAYRLDCIIFVKCMVYWRWYKPNKNDAHGGAVYDPRYDWTEIGILNHCSNVGYDKFLSAKEGAYLYMDGHGGFKIDEFTRNGKTYNVAECTVGGAFGSPRKCIYSYVDDYGGRWNYKGGTYGGRWTAHGELQGVTYNGVTPQPTPKDKPYSIDNVAVKMMRGDFGNGEDRKTKLRALGYTDAEIQQAQNIVNQVYKRNERDNLTSTIAMRLIAGAGGDGASVRRTWVEKEYGDGTLYDEAQKKINWYLE